MDAGFSQYVLGDRADSVRGMQKATAILSKLASQNPVVPQFRSELVWNYRFLAGQQRELGQTAEAARSLRLARRDRVAAEGRPRGPVHPGLRPGRAGAGSRVDEQAGIIADEQAERQRDADRAVETLKEAIAAGFRDTARLDSTVELEVLRSREDFRSLRAGLVALVSPGAGQTSPAARLKASQQVLGLRQALVASDPKNRRLRSDQAASQHAIGLIQLELGRLDQAAGILAEAMATRDALVKEEPENARYRADLAESYLADGEVLRRSGKPAEGMKKRLVGLDQLDAAVRADRATRNGPFGCCGSKKP